MARIAIVRYYNNIHATTSTIPHKLHYAMFDPTKSYQTELHKKTRNVAISSGSFCLELLHSNIQHTFILTLISLTATVVAANGIPTDYHQHHHAHCSLPLNCAQHITIPLCLAAIKRPSHRENRNENRARALASDCATLT